MSTNLTFQCQQCGLMITQAFVHKHLNHKCGDEWLFVPNRGVPDSPANDNSHQCHICGALFRITSNQKATCPFCDNTKSFTILTPVDP